MFLSVGTEISIRFQYSIVFAYFPINTGWNDKIVVLKKATLQLYFKTFIEKINSGNLVM